MPKLNHIPVICLGESAWDNATRRNGCKGHIAFVMPPDIEPEALEWLIVSGRHAQIVWGFPAPATLVFKLAVCLLNIGALSVLVYPIGIGGKQPPVLIHAPKWEGQKKAEDILACPLATDQKPPPVMFKIDRQQTDWKTQLFEQLKSLEIQIKAGSNNG